jgi:hypothetical protein
MVCFYIVFNRFKSKTEVTANSYAFIYSLLVNIITLGIVMTLSNPNLNENTWSFVLFSAPAVLGVPMTLFGVSLVPVVLMCLIPLVLVFHAARMDVYIGAIGVAFAATLLAAGWFQYYVVGWTVSHGFGALKAKIRKKAAVIILSLMILIIVTLIGIFSWSRMHDMLDATYLEKRQEMKYW